MKNYLKSFYLQGDAEMQTLTKNANSNFLLKLLYLRRGRTVFADLYGDYKKEIGADSISDWRIRSVMQRMKGWKRNATKTGQILEKRDLSRKYETE